MVPSPRRLVEHQEHRPDLGEKRSNMSNVWVITGPAAASVAALPGPLGFDDFNVGLCRTSLAQMLEWGAEPVPVRNCLPLIGLVEL